MLLLFIFCALRSGSDRYYLLKTEKAGVKGRELFYFLRPSALAGTFVFYLNYYLRKLLYIVLCFLPCVGAVLFLFYYLEYGRASLAVSVVLSASAAVFLVNGIIYYFRFSSLLFVSRYLFASGNFTSWRKLFLFSAGCVEGKRGVILKQKLKLTGWFLSCILVFPASFVQNYYRETMAGLAKALMENRYLQNC